MLCARVLARQWANPYNHPVKRVIYFTKIKLCDILIKKINIKKMNKTTVLALGILFTAAAALFAEKTGSKKPKAKKEEYSGEKESDFC